MKSQMIVPREKSVERDFEGADVIKGFTGVGGTFLVLKVDKLGKGCICSCHGIVIVLGTY